MFLITGAGRSGTLFMANLLVTSGYQVGHEFEDKYGLVSWLHLDRAERYDPVIQQVRNPVNTITSTMVVPQKSLYRTFNLIPEPEDKDMLYLSMYTWYHWNKLAEEKSSWTFRIENLDNIYPELFDRLGLEAPKKLPEIPRDIHSAKRSKKYKQLTWKDLYRRDEELADKIFNLAKHYGYNPQKT